jgi:hypothetical protein
VLAALRLYLRDAAQSRCTTARSVAEALDALAARDGAIALPGYTHMQQAMPSTVALWASGFAAEIRDDAEGLGSRSGASNKNPLGSAAGYGTPNLPIDREATRAAPRVRGHARAGDGRAAVARQGRGAAAVRDHAAHAGLGRSRPTCCCSIRRNSAS